MLHTRARTQQPRVPDPRPHDRHDRRSNAASQGEQCGCRHDPPLDGNVIDLHDPQFLRRVSYEHRQPRPGHPQAECSSRSSQDHAFDDAPSEQASKRGAQRSAEGELSRVRFAVGDQQVHHVGRRHQHQQDGRREQQPQDLAGPWSNLPRTESVEIRAPACGALELRMLGSDDVHSFGSQCGADASREAAYRPVVRGARIRGRWRGRNPDPCLNGRERKPKRRPHHTDHGVWHGIEPHHPADNRRVGAKGALPQSM